jgi:DNA end-binding protein Ku
MPRAIWSGSISFGLVNIPVKLYSAVSRKTVHFNQLDSRTRSRIKQKRVSAEDGTEVPYDQIVKGYELAGGSYVVVTDDELAALDPKAVRTIDIDEFVDLVDIDPVFYDAAYYLAPDKSSKPYALLARAMEETGKVGIAKFVMRTKQYLAALRPKEGKLLISTMVYADEIIPAEEISDLDGVDAIDVSDRELAMAKQLIDSLTTEFQPEVFRDEYRDKVLELIEQKASGVETIVEAPAAVEETKVVDLLAALEASVKDARAARKRHPAAAEAESTDEEPAEEKPAPKKTRAKKSA